jgi:hypothetical protein
MKLTIIPSDGAVYENNVDFTGLTWEGTPVNVHALQWFDTEGWIEFKDSSPNETITVLPDWANNAMAAWQSAYDKAHADPLPPTAEDNKSFAAYLLQQTDWTTIPDVADPTKSNPYLGNAEEFVIYRNSVRQYAINPIAGDIDWPVVPKAVWVTV